MFWRRGRDSLCFASCPSWVELCSFVHSVLSVQNKKANAPSGRVSFFIMAEKARFELANGVTHYSLSKRAPSATRPPLRYGERDSLFSFPILKELGLSRNQIHFRPRRLTQSGFRVYFCAHCALRKSYFSKGFRAFPLSSRRAYARDGSIMKIYGFSYVRNGESIGYPYYEAFQCLSAFCDHTYLAVGDSNDGTREKLSQLPKVTILDTVWEEKMRVDGAIFSQQANLALAELRKQHQDGWALHLQADQIVCEKDFDQLRTDFELAERNGCDGFSMRFLHFWVRPDQLAYSKRWFPQTINAVKVDSKGISVGDSQSLGNCEKVYDSDVQVFHYGHALGEKYLEKKQRALHRWWHKDGAIDAVMKKSKKKDAKESSLSYLGVHPKWIQERQSQDRKPVSECWVVGSHPELKEFLPRIGANKVHVVDGIEEVPKRNRKRAVILFPKWWEKLLYPTKVPVAMKWPNSRPWPFSFWMILKLSEKGIPTDLQQG